MPVFPSLSYLSYNNRSLVDYLESAHLVDSIHCAVDALLHRLFVAAFRPPQKHPGSAFGVGSRFRQALRRAQPNRSYRSILDVYSQGC